MSPLPAYRLLAGGCICTRMRLSIGGGDRCILHMQGTAGGGDRWQYKCYLHPNAYPVRYQLPHHQLLHHCHLQLRCHMLFRRCSMQAPAAWWGARRELRTRNLSGMAVLTAMAGGSRSCILHFYTGTSLPYAGASSPPQGEQTTLPPSTTMQALHPPHTQGQHSSDNARL